MLERWRCYNNRKDIWSAALLLLVRRKPWLPVFKHVFGLWSGRGWSPQSTGRKVRMKPKSFSWSAYTNSPTFLSLKLLNLQKKIKFCPPAVGEWKRQKNLGYSYVFRKIHFPHFKININKPQGGPIRHGHDSRRHRGIEASDCIRAKKCWDLMKELHIEIL